MRPGWAFQLVDHDYSGGSWSWDVDRRKLLGIMGFLQEMEKKTWGEIRAEMTGGFGRRGEKHKYMDVQSLCPEAQRRLTDIELDDQDRLFRFRLGNLERLWGIVLPDDHIFYALWWDPSHKVCPSADR